MSRTGLRVTFVLTTPDAVGGTERSTYQLASELSRRADLEVRIVGIVREQDEPHFAADVSVPLHYLIDARPGSPASTGSDDAPSAFVDARWEPAFSARADRLLADDLAADPPDVVVATTPALLALLCEVAPPSTAIVSVEHRATAARGVSAEPFAHYGERADAIVSLTDAGTAWFEATLGGRGPLLATIPNMVPRGFAPRSALTQPTVVAAGRLVRSKQFSHVVRAFALARRPGWRLRIFGDGPERGALHRLVLRLGVHDHADLVPNVRDIRYELAKASMLVMSSTAEGQPLVALEALSTGVPIVSYDCPVGPRTIVDDGVNGFLVPPNDVDALARAMRTLIDDPELRDRMGADAHRSSARFAAAAVADAWHSLLVEVAAAGRPRRRAIAPNRVAEASLGSAPVLGPWVPAGGLLLHIGPHKTGTTAIQSALSAARPQLQQLGVVYPGTTPAPHGAVMSRLGTFRGWNDAIAPGSLEMWEQLCVETRTANGTVVVSSEALCHASDSQAAAVCEELRHGPVRVAITVRPLAQVLPSSWQEYVKSGWTTSYEDFLRFVLDKPESPDNPTPTFWIRHDHGRLVQRWADAVGVEHVVVIVADPADRTHLVRVFEELLGLPERTLRHDAGPVNRSLSAVETELLRRVNLAVRETLPWGLFNQLLRLGGTPALVEGRRPAADEAALGLPAWAVERARELGARAAEQIRSTGVRVEGRLELLAASTPVTEAPSAGAGDACVPIDAVVRLLEGTTRAMAARRSRVAAWSDPAGP